MKRKIWIWILLLMLSVIPGTASAGEGSMQEQAIRWAFGENLPEVQMLEDEGQEILSLKLHQALDADMNYTYEDGWMLTGTAEPGTHVGVIVYTESEKQSPIVWYDQETVVGASGLYQEKVPLQLLDMQHILILVRNDNVCAGREYLVVRKSEDICTELLDYELNLYEEYGIS